MGVPERADSDEILDLSRWHRVKWRTDKKKDAPGICLICRLPIHRVGTYYLRPAYTDGTRWICARDFRKISVEATGRIDNRYSRRREGTEKED